MKPNARDSRVIPRTDKTCATCGRPFAWRRKWAQCWEQVRYCSQACRKGHGKADFVPR